jgi:hypothetical protein
VNLRTATLVSSGRIIEAVLEESGGSAYSANGAVDRLPVPSKPQELLQALLETFALDGSTNFTKTTKTSSSSHAAISDTYKWHSTCISKRAF